MTRVKNEEKYYFPQGHIWVLMDDEWGVEIIGEDGIGGTLTGMASWDFKTQDAWKKWGQFCNEQIQKIKERFNQGEISIYQVTGLIYSLDRMMETSIKESLVA